MSHQAAIRHLGVQELDSIMPVMNSAFDANFGEAWNISQCRGLMCLPGSFLLGARFEDVVAGFAMARTVVDEAELLLLAVHRESQGIGIGSLLIERVVTECIQRHVVSVHLEVRENNPALRFYTKHGFEKAGARRDYYKSASGEMFNAITLRRNIR